MLKRMPIITLQIPTTVTSADGRTVAVIPRPIDADWVCRWCYGRPMAGYDVCSRRTCIQAWTAVQQLHVIIWKGE